MALHYDWSGSESTAGARGPNVLNAMYNNREYACPFRGKSLRRAATPRAGNSKASNLLIQHISADLSSIFLVGCDGYR